MARPEWIEVGRVSRPHGVHGEVRVIPDSDNPKRFAKGSVVHARPGRASVAGGRSLDRVRLSISAVRGESEFPIIAFAEVAGREAAEGIRGFILEVPGDELPALGVDEYYPFEIEGLAVKDSNGAVVGRVTEVIDSPAHPLIAIVLEAGGEVLVPFVLAAVLGVSVKDGYLVVEERFLEPISGRP